MKVNDLAASVDFYTRIMGFTDEGVNGAFHIIRVSNDFQLHLAPWSTAGFEQHAFAVSAMDFKAIFARIQSAGIDHGPTFDSVGTHNSPGRENGARGVASTLYFMDPNKHLVEIRSYAMGMELPAGDLP